jgi:hypothetical protein
MHIDPALLSPVSALQGALMGGAASLIAAIYTHRSSERLRRVAAEITKRETVYADFVMRSSNLLLKAYTSDELVLTGDGPAIAHQRAGSLPADVVSTAEAVLKAIVEISLNPSIELRQLAKRCQTPTQSAATFQPGLPPIWKMCGRRQRSDVP